MDYILDACALIAFFQDISHAVVREAGRYKTSYSMSLGDSIFVATARCTGATIVTCDHIELGPVERQENIPFLWIRQQS